MQGRRLSHFILMILILVGAFAFVGCTAAGSQRASDGFGHRMAGIPDDALPGEYWQTVFEGVAVDVAPELPFGISDTVAGVSAGLAGLAALWGAGQRRRRTRSDDDFNTLVRNQEIVMDEKGVINFKDPALGKMLKISNGPRVEARIALARDGV